MFSIISGGLQNNRAH